MVRDLTRVLQRDFGRFWPRRRENGNATNQEYEKMDGERERASF